MKVQMSRELAALSERTVIVRGLMAFTDRSSFVLEETPKHYNSRLLLVSGGSALLYRNRRPFAYERRERLQKATIEYFGKVEISHEGETGRLFDNINHNNLLYSNAEAETYIVKEGSQTLADASPSALPFFVEYIRLQVLLDHQLIAGVLRTRFDAFVERQAQKWIALSKQLEALI